MELLHRCISAIITAALVLYSGGCSLREVSAKSIEAAADRKYGIEVLREDFNQFRKFIEEKHPKLYNKDAELSKLFDDQFGLLKDNMGEMEFYRILSPVVSALRCGHTNLMVSEGYEAYMRNRGRYLPFHIKAVGDRIYVYENLSPTNIPRGSEILSINGRAASEIVKTLLKNLTADGYNETKKYQIMNNWFNGIFYNYVDNSNEFKITYKIVGEAKSKEASVSSIRDNKMDMTAMSIYFIDRTDEEIYYGEIFDDYAVLTVKSYNINDLRKYKQYIYSFFEKLKGKNIKNLVLDLRGNWGGAPAPAAFLYSYLNNKPAPYYSETPFLFFSYKWPVVPAVNCFEGKLYTLIDGASFSTTGHQIALIKYHNIGSFIGEESGAAGTVTDLGRFVTLKNTGLRMYCATGVFKAAVSGMGEGRGIIPDYKATYTIEDYLKGRDLEKEAALELIKKSGK